MADTKKIKMKAAGHEGCRFLFAQEESIIEAGVRRVGANVRAWGGVVNLL